MKLFYPRLSGTPDSRDIPYLFHLSKKTVSVVVFIGNAANNFKTKVESTAEEQDIGLESFPVPLSMGYSDHT